MQKIGWDDSSAFISTLEIISPLRDFMFMVFDSCVLEDGSDLKYSLSLHCPLLTLAKAQPCLQDGFSPIKAELTGFLLWSCDSEQHVNWRRVVLNSCFGANTRLGENVSPFIGFREVFKLGRESTLHHYQTVLDRTQV